MDFLLHEYLPTLLLGIVMGIKLSGLFNNKKEEKEQPQTEKPVRSPFDEVFPELDILEIEGEKPLVQSKEDAKSKPVANEQTDTPAEQLAMPVAAVEAVAEQCENRTEKQTVKRRNHLSLRTKSEVKQAFLYAEVLNRKY